MYAKQDEAPKNAAIAAKTAALPQIPKALLEQFAAAGSPVTAG